MQFKARVGAVRADGFCSAEASIRVNVHQGRKRAAADLCQQQVGGQAVLPEDCLLSLFDARCDVV